jgi:TRAP-type C4-dicarboxylate transport system permease small subunit
MLNLVTNITTKLGEILEIIAVALLALMAIFVMLSAFMRYAVGSPFAFTEDFVGLLFCVIVFLVLPSVQRSRRHITVDLFVATEGHWVAKVQEISRTVIVLVFCIWFGLEAYKFAYYTWANNSVTLVGDFPIYPWVSVIVFSVLLMGIIATLKCVSRLRTTNTPDFKQGEE